MLRPPTDIRNQVIALYPGLTKHYECHLTGNPSDPDGSQRSIDRLSLSFLNVPIVAPAIIIGIVTFSLSFVGVYLGNHFGHFLGNKVEVVGGIILIAIGLRIFLEHL